MIKRSGNGKGIDKYRRMRPSFMCSSTSNLIEE